MSEIALSDASATTPTETADWRGANVPAHFGAVSPRLGVLEDRKTRAPAFNFLRRGWQSLTEPLMLGNSAAISLSGQDRKWLIADDIAMVADSPVGDAG